jgi:hypothetical protein
VATQKLTTVDGFVVIDLDDAPVSTGIVRSAPTILASGAADLARTLTYAYASLGMQRGGASAGVMPPTTPRRSHRGVHQGIGPLVAAGTFSRTPARASPRSNSRCCGDDPAPVSDKMRDRLVAVGAIAAGRARRSAHSKGAARHRGL